MISDKHISVTLSAMGLIITIALVGIVLTNSTGPLLSSSSKTTHKVQAQEQIQEQQQHQPKTA
jgi:hypothetical protein